MRNVNPNAQPLTQKVASAIEQLIIERQFTTGDKLPNEFELAEALNVGRGTIREAIKILSSRNIVEIQRGKGTFVASKPGMVEDPLGLNFLQTDKQKLAQDLLAVRMMIEPEIAALAAKNATNNDIIELEKVCAEIESQIHTDESHEEKDRIFHTLLAKASKNVVVPNLLPTILSAVSLFIDVTDNQLKEETIETHRGIVDALKARDDQKAKKYMIQHLTYNKNILKKLAKKNQKTNE